jgi:hypothetical protein
MNDVSLEPNPVDLAPEPVRALPAKRRHGLAITWWTACSLWAYFAFGELVVAAGYPEALGVLCVLLGFVAAGQRVHSRFDDARAVAIGGGIVVLLSSVLAVVLPAFLLTFTRARNVALLGLTLALATALVSLRFVRRVERAERSDMAIATPANRGALPRILAWLLSAVFTLIALALAAQE